MPIVDLLHFDIAMEDTDSQPHLLLGNGFSRSFRDDLFSYEALFLQAEFETLNDLARQAFQRLETADFEEVMHALRSAASLVELYRAELVDLVQTLRSDAEGLKNLLATTIARNHPEGPFDVSDEQFEACRRFVSQFKNVYTLNYDLLLYWALMHEDGSEYKISCDDGFRTPEDDVDYVTWEVENTLKQNVFYLHGALHIFDAGSEIKKFTWAKTGIRLIDQIRAALDANMYPLIVAEGTSQQKLEKINHSNYLSRAYRRLSGIGGSLFTFGHSMGPSDEHILRLIEHGKVSDLCVGVYGDPASEPNQAIITRSLVMPTNRALQARRRPGLRVRFFDAASAMVWG